MMNVKELSTKLEYTVFALPDPVAQVTDGYTSDLLSDVMGNAAEDSVLITIQAHRNTIAVASLIGIKAIVLCNGRVPSPDMVVAAEQETVALLGTAENQFTTSHRIAAALGIS
ncbi:MAG TPA: iron-sulfur binding hydrogenase [Sphaerochaeta sp.]|nr:iron-sulfur binding hydrogenase [Sphaerochaeta sp.]